MPQRAKSWNEFDLLRALVIVAIVICVLGFTVAAGWKLGITETINLVMVPGLSVDYVAHLAEAYTESHAARRLPRVRSMIMEVGVSVISGAISTLGASAFLWLPVIIFFNKVSPGLFGTLLLAHTPKKILTYGRPRSRV